MTEALDENGLGGKVKKIIGETPFSQTFADELDADAYGHGAIDEVEKLGNFVQTRKHYLFS